eukprot:gene24701-30616_t
MVDKEKWNQYALPMLLDLCLFRWTDTHNMPPLPYGVRLSIKECIYEKLHDGNIVDAVACWCTQPTEALHRFGHISQWDVSRVTTLRLLFVGRLSFNDDISSWDVRRVTSMMGMFHYCRVFNQPLDRWDVSRVTDMDEMFCFAEHFN